MRDRHRYLFRSHLRVRLSSLGLLVSFPLLPGPATAQVSKADLMGPVPPAECRADGEDRIPVLIVGSYHMSNPGADRFNLESDDVLSPRRQEEIEDVVAQLSAFEPTVVALESPWGDTTNAADYGAWLAGEHELRRKEEEQIGFRVAQRAGLETVHPVDARMGLPDSLLMATLEMEPSLGRYLAEIEPYGEAAMALMDEMLSELTIGEFLWEMNSPEGLAANHTTYFRFFLPIAAEDSYGGADYVAVWYRRNLRIAANIGRIAEPGDRVFLIIGQGHAPILRQVLTDWPRFCLEDPLNYLPEPGEG
jgi:hypothetical protein